MNKSLRIRIIKKLAQAATPLPTAPAVAATTVIAPPPAFQTSSMYPTVRKGYNANSVQILDNFISLLNTAIHYVTSGKINFQTFKNNNFNFDASAAPSVDQKNIMNFSKKVYQNLLNNGTFTKALTAQEINDKVNLLFGLPEYNNLSQVQPAGQVAIKIGGNLKTLIFNQLTYLKNANPLT